MSEEEKHFNRSQTGHDANDLHKHGGLEAHEEEKTNREELEEAIEALEEGEDDDEVADVESIEGVEHEASEEVASEDEIKENEAIEKIEAEAKPEEIKPTRPSMTIDEVEEKKAKCGAGWKVCTVLFLLLAIAGCGAAAYLFFNNGKVEMLGRTVESHKTTDKPASTPAAEPTTVAPVDNTTSQTGQLIYLDGYNLAIKVPETLENISYDYHQFNMGGEESTWLGNYSTLGISGSKKKEDAISIPVFLDPVTHNNQQQILGYIIIGKVGQYGVIGEPIMELDDGRGIYYEGPQALFSENPDDQQWEQESIDEIKQMLTNKDNYIKLQ